MGYGERDRRRMAGGTCYTCKKREAGRFRDCIECRLNRAQLAQDRFSVSPARRKARKAIREQVARRTLSYVRAKQILDAGCKLAPDKSEPHRD